VAASSTGTSLALALLAKSEAHLPSAFAKAFHVNSKSALTAVAVETAELVLTGTLDSPTYATKVSYLTASPLSILRRSVATVYQVSVWALTVAVHVILTYGFATTISVHSLSPAKS